MCYVAENHITANVTQNSDTLKLKDISDEMCKWGLEKLYRVENI